MKTQLAIDFTAIAPRNQTFPIEHLKKASKRYSADKIIQGKIRGVFFHQNMPHCCTGVARQSGVYEVSLCRLYTPTEFAIKQLEEEQDNNYWGKSVKHGKTEWIMGQGIKLRPHPRERKIDKAKYSLAWAKQFLERFENPDDPSTIEKGWRDYYTKQIQEARVSQVKARQTLDQLGLSHVFTSPEELTKYWEQEMKYV